MAKPENSGFYTVALLTLNANSSDEYVKGIYDEWAEKYDKVLPLSVIFTISETIRAMCTSSFWPAYRFLGSFVWTSVNYL